MIAGGKQNKNKMKFRVTFTDIFENVESEEQVYDALIEYLYQCVKNEDVTAFEIEQIEE
jgi:hypothetical protein